MTTDFDTAREWIERLDRGAGGFVNRLHVVAVDDLRRHTVGGGAHGDVGDRHLLADRGRVGVLIVLDHHDERCSLDRRQVE